eukprot:4350331-Amphidinium_carterae.1
MMGAQQFFAKDFGDVMKICDNGAESIQLTSLLRHRNQPTPTTGSIVAQEAPPLHTLSEMFSKLSWRFRYDLDNLIELLSTAKLFLCNHPEEGLRVGHVAVFFDQQPLYFRSGGYGSKPDPG